MKKLLLIAATASLGACVTMPSSTGVRNLGNDTYMMSEMSGFGNVIERANRFCSDFGQSIDVRSSTTEKGLASGDDYAVIVFGCVS